MSKESISNLLPLAERLHSTSIRLLRRVRKVDELTGLSPSTLSAMSVLVFGGPCSLGDLARAEQVRAPTMTRIVGELESAGYVKRVASKSDRRVVQIRATPKGIRLLKQGRSRRAQLVAEWLDALSVRDRKKVEEAVTILERVVQAAQ
ncbi:MAG: MarR family transcriptional regulator [Planctomycetes bacterium]|nr:MarR family transcriptional regulator [Planctomycetota bacterium]